MPDVRPGETEQEYLERCIPEVIGEGASGDQAIAICISKYNDEKDYYKNLVKEEDLLYYKAFDKKRNTYLKEYRSKAKKAMLEMLKPIMEAENVSQMRVELSPKPLEDYLEDLFVKVGSAFAKQSFRNLKKQTPLEIKQKNPDFRERMINYSKQGRRERVIARSEGLVIQKLISQTIEQRLGPKDAADYVKDRIATKIDDYQAERIARTEIIAASNAGSLAGAKSTGLPLNKRWVSTNDDRTRPAHRPQNIQNLIVDLDAPFYVGGEELDFPGDQKGRPGNIINCRCTQVYVTKEETQEIQEEQQEQERENPRPKYKPSGEEWDAFIGQDEITLPDEFWNLLKQPTPFIRERTRSEKSLAYYSPGVRFGYRQRRGVYLGTNERSVLRFEFDDRSKSRVLAHEYGHAAHFQNNIITDDFLSEEWQRFKSEVSELIKKNKFLMDAPDYTRAGIEDKSIFKWWAGRSEHRHANKIRDLRDTYRLREPIASFGEDQSAVADFLQGFTKGRKGYGHTKSYQSSMNNGDMEMFAHIAEFYYVGNRYARVMMPEVYELCRKYFATVVDQYSAIAKWFKKYIRMKKQKKPPKTRLEFTEEENAILDAYIEKYGEDPTLDYAISLGDSAALELIKKANGRRIVEKKIGIGGFEFTFE